MDAGDLGIAQLGEFNATLDGALGVLGAIRGHEDMLEHSSSFAASKRRL
jgi:hypothetical protein